MNSKNKGIGGALVEAVSGRLGGKKKTVIDTEADLRGCRALVTGANSGLGKGIAVRLAKNGATVVMAGRTMDEKARQDVVRASGNGDVHLARLDLASFASVRDFISAMTCALPFQLVVINAAIITPDGRLTGDGLDEMTQVNFLSNVLLIEQLLAVDRVRSFPDGRAARIVVVSSEAHRWCDGIDMDAVDQPKTFVLKQALRNYSDTKFMMAAYAAHLARTLKAAGSSIAVHAICPGAVNSNIARSAPKFIQPLLKVIFPLFFASPHKASGPVVHLSLSPSLEGRTGVYFHQRQEKAFDSRAADPAFGTALFERGMQIISDKA